MKWPSWEFMSLHKLLCVEISVLGSIKFSFQVLQDICMTCIWIFISPSSCLWFTFALVHSRSYFSTLSEASEYHWLLIFLVWTWGLHNAADNFLLPPAFLGIRLFLSGRYVHFWGPQLHSIYSTQCPFAWPSQKSLTNAGICQSRGIFLNGDARYLLLG